MELLAVTRSYMGIAQFFPSFNENQLGKPVRRITSG